MELYPTIHEQYQYDAFIDVEIENVNKMNGILILDLFIIPNTTRIVFYDVNG